MINGGFICLRFGHAGKASWGTLELRARCAFVGVSDIVFKVLLLKCVIGGYMLFLFGICFLGILFICFLLVFTHCKFVFPLLIHGER